METLASVAGSNRDVLGPDEMPSLDSSNGQSWLLREIEALQPDVIFFDAIMCLVGGNMSEEASWTPIKTLVRKLSSMRIGQVWLHHTGHDTTRGYGTKTREWEMESVVMLEKVKGNDADDGTTQFTMTFSKARLRTPHNYDQFETRTVTSGKDGFSWISGKRRKATRGRGGDQMEVVRNAFVSVYQQLTERMRRERGCKGKSTLKVRVESIRDEMFKCGFLDPEENNPTRVSSTSRSHFFRAKNQLLALGGFFEDDGWIWQE